MPFHFASHKRLQLTNLGLGFSAPVSHAGRKIKVVGSRVDGSNPKIMLGSFIKNPRILSKFIHEIGSFTEKPSHLSKLICNSTYTQVILCKPPKLFRNNICSSHVQGTFMETPLSFEGMPKGLSILQNLSQTYYQNLTLLRPLSDNLPTSSSFT